MKKGEKVKIYRDPITCKNLEGEARLKRHISMNDASGCESWLVTFSDEPEREYQRLVNKDCHK